MILLSPSADAYSPDQVVASDSGIGHHYLHRGRVAVTMGPSSRVITTDGTPSALNYHSVRMWSDETN